MNCDVWLVLEKVRTRDRNILKTKSLQKNIYSLVLLTMPKFWLKDHNKLPWKDYNNEHSTKYSRNFRMQVSKQKQQLNRVKGVSHQAQKSHQLFHLTCRVQHLWILLMSCFVFETRLLEKYQYFFLRYEDPPCGRARRIQIALMKVRGGEMLA